VVFASVAHSDIYVSGDVRIDPNAVIAPGVIIQAAADSYVAIAAGVCLGMGAILQAHQGNIEICQGAMIGAGVLIVGNSTIGENACIGYGTTIFRASILATTVISPNSLLGDISRQPGETTQNQPNQNTTQNKAEKKNIPKTEPFPQNQGKTPEDPWGAEFNPSPQPPIENPLENAAPEEIKPPSADDNYLDKEEQKISIPEPPEILVKEPVSEEKAPVVGKVYINQLLMTLFPNNHPINPLNNTESK
jgi:carbon dioxide concentrating mechanism protein CcmN